MCENVLMITKIKPFIYLFLFVLTFFALFVFLFLTNPKSLPLPLLLVPVILVFIIFYLIFYWLISRSIFTNKKFSRSSSVVMAICLSFIPVILLTLASIQQFTFRDIILSVLFLVLFFIYFMRADFVR